MQGFGGDGGGTYIGDCCGLDATGCRGDGFGIIFTTQSDGGGALCCKRRGGPPNARAETYQ